MPPPAGQTKSGIYTISVPRCTSHRSLEKIHQCTLQTAWEQNSEQGILHVFPHTVIPTFDLLTPKPNQFTPVPRCTNDKSSVEIHQCTP